MDSVDKQIQTLSVIVSRMNLAARMGKAYDNSRDLFQALGYPPNIEYDDLLARYYRQDIVRAVVDKPVKATWRSGFKLVETADANETPFEKEWADLSLKLKLSSVFTRLDRLCAFGDYGVLLLGFDDVTALEEFAQPVQSGKRRLNYLRPFGQANAVIQQWETDPNNERYGLPVTYQITTVAPGTSSTSTALVHYSRILHVAEDLLESDVQGLSRLEPIYNRFMDLEKLVGGSAEMFWRGARPGYQGKIDPDYTMTSETKDDLKSQIDEFEHNLRRILVNEGIDLTSLQQQIADPASHVDVQLQMISAVTGIPKRILVGSERGELSSSQDQDAWSDLITNRREDFVEPCIIRPFVERVCLYGVISSPADMTYDIEWPSMYESSDQEKAQVGAIRATALKDYCSNPTAESVIPPKAFFQFFLGFEEEDIELIEQMVEEGMTKEEAAMKQIGVTPEQVDAIKNPQPVSAVQPTGAQPKKESPAVPQTHSFPGHAGRPGQVGGSMPSGKAMSIEGGRKLAQSGKKAAGIVTPEPKKEPEWRVITKADRGELRTAQEQIRQIIPYFSDISVEGSVPSKRVVEMVNTFGSEVFRMNAEFPGFRNRIKENPSLVRYLKISAKMELGVGGTYERSYDRITLASTAGNCGGLTKIQPGGGAVNFGKWNSVNGLDGCIRHEIGHAIAKTIKYNTRVTGTSWNNTLSKAAGSRDSAAMNKWSEKNISKYSKTNFEEAFCEAFSGYTSPKYGAGKSKKLTVDLENYFMKLLR